MKPFLSLPSLALASFLLTYFPQQVQAMGSLDFMRIYIFSEVNGVVLLDGKPVKGAKIIRTTDYKDSIHSDTTVADEQGRFHFDDHYEYSMRLHETAILQKIIIEHDDKEYLAWKLLKRNDHRFGELNDASSTNPLKPLTLTCELTGDVNNEQTVGAELRRRTIYGLSTWD